mmetsp:Transcript_46451/g.109122  ORF Transcript_46451/g.109122 Transcript_46451/m.109122 type:complete len:200 (+) Transcript_46451:2183-2782(+)
MGEAACVLGHGVGEACQVLVHARRRAGASGDHGPPCLLHRLQLVDESVGVGAVGGPVGPALVHELDEADGRALQVRGLHRRAPRRRPHRLVALLRHLLDDLHYVHPLPRNRPREHLPHDEPDAVHVDAHPVRVAQHHLRRHVLWGAGDGLGAGEDGEGVEDLREAKVGHLDALVVRDQQVQRLEVAVDEARVVDGAEAV